ncbi:MAG: hypothetical protein GY940_12570 [bacterium]|nr:hypothetical protein [bacterium]
MTKRQEYFEPGMNTPGGTDKDKNKDYDYIVTIIQYLELNHGIAFFITPRDFDCLYNWWEKRIPDRVIRESITAVVKRWQKKNKAISGFSNFKYEVRKNFTAFLQLSLGSESTGTEPGENSDGGEDGDQRFVEIDAFFNRFPEPLQPLRKEFEELYSCLKNNDRVETAGLHGKLTEMFARDTELNLKTAIFLKNLAPQLRKPGIEERYRLNWLINKFHIPDFEIL